MEKKDNKYPKEGWYHVVFGGMIILPFFLIAITPEGFWSFWVITLFILLGVSGFLLIVYVPFKGDVKKVKDEEG